MLYFLAVTSVLMTPTGEGPLLHCADETKKRNQKGLDGAPSRTLTGMLVTAHGNFRGASRSAHTKASYLSDDTRCFARVLEVEGFAARACSS